MLDVIDYLKNDRGCVINEISIGPATPIIIQEQIPFSSKVYDFSRVANKGYYNYNQRTIKVTATVMAEKKNSIDNLYSVITSRVASEASIKIQDDSFRGYYLGKLVNYSEMENNVFAGKFTLEFSCDPFKIDTVALGDDVWDIFQFDTDYFTSNVIEMTTSASSITLIVMNAGVAKTPIIEISPDHQCVLSCIQNGVTVSTISHTNAGGTTGTINTDNFRFPSGEFNLEVKTSVPDKDFTITITLVPEYL